MGKVVAFPIEGAAEPSASEISRDLQEFGDRLLSAASALGKSLVQLTEAIIEADLLNDLPIEAVAESGALLREEVETLLPIAGKASRKMVYERARQRGVPPSTMSSLWRDLAHNRAAAGCFPRFPECVQALRASSDPADRKLLERIERSQ